MIASLLLPLRFCCWPNDIFFPVLLPDAATAAAKPEVLAGLDDDDDDDAAAAVAAGLRPCCRLDDTSAS